MSQTETKPEVRLRVYYGDHAGVLFKDYSADEAAAESPPSGGALAAVRSAAMRFTARVSERLIALQDHLHQSGRMMVYYCGPQPEEPAKVLSVPEAWVVVKRECQASGQDFEDVHRRVLAAAAHSTLPLSAARIQTTLVKLALRRCRDLPSDLPDSLPVSAQWVSKASASLHDCQTFLQLCQAIQWEEQRPNPPPAVPQPFQPKPSECPVP